MRLDSIYMLIIAIGESLKNLDNITNRDLLNRYSEIDWKDAKGMRDIISHHYFDVDEEIVLDVCRTHMPRLAETVRCMLADLGK